MHQEYELKVVNNRKKMNKATFKAHTDIAFVKYWGKKDEKLRLPENGSISIKLSDLHTTTTVHFSDEYQADQITIDGKQSEKESARATKHLDRIRKLAAKKKLPTAEMKAKVVSENSFPKATGLSSSGSGFAALTLAGSKAVGLELSSKELSILARQGSGSACRATCGGFVEWYSGDTSETSFAETIFPADHMEIYDVVVIVSDDTKAVPTSDSMLLADSSLIFKPRQHGIEEKLTAVRNAIKERDFSVLGRLIEEEALEFHSLLLTMKPSYIALKPASLAVMLTVQQLRKEGTECYFTMNTGHNIHVLTTKEHVAKVTKEMNAIKEVQQVFQAQVADAPLELDQHLF
jgi:diphosphomevalonate decarboxylase